LSQNQKLKYHIEPKILKADDIHKNNYNPNFVSSQIMNAIKDDIQKHGFIGHIAVQKKSSDGTKNVIINGEHRYEALKQLGQNEIPVIILDVPDETAKLLTLRLNREHGELMPDKVADLLKDLDKDQDMEKLAAITAMDQRELSILMRFDENIGKQIQQATTVPKELTSYAHGGGSVIEQEDDDTTIFYGWQEVEESVVILAEKLRNKYKNPAKEFAAIYAVPNGGLIPARLLARELDFYIQKSPHHGENIITSISKKIKPLLVVDDILDTGRTYDAVEKQNKDIEFATLVHRKSPPAAFNVSYGKSLNGDKRWVRFPWEKTNEKRRKEINI